MAKYTDKSGFTWKSKAAYYKYLGADQSKSESTRKRFKTMAKRLKGCKK
jgi:hypothetical protein